MCVCVQTAQEAYLWPVQQRWQVHIHLTLSSILGYNPLHQAPKLAPTASNVVLFRRRKTHPHADSLRDRLIIAFHESLPRPAPLQSEADGSPLFSFFTFSLLLRSLAQVATLFTDPPTQTLLFPPDRFLECCVDKPTQAPVIFTPGMHRVREKDRGHKKGDGEGKHGGEEAGRRWQVTPSREKQSDRRQRQRKQSNN